MRNVFLQPARAADGSPLLVRDPSSKAPLKPGGEWKTLNIFWTRRLRDRDVIEAAPPARTDPGDGILKVGVGLPADGIARAFPIVEIPSDWRRLHHTQRVKLAEDLAGDFVVPDGKTRTQAADAAIEAEVARRAAAGA